ncbi:MAG: hypothetical protein M9962_03285 [Oligoflexia bacterium]|nr:hypothetical protein [Oligoflexia bacterium]
MEKKTIKFYDDFGFGFQVRINNAPMVKIRGEWVLDLDHRKLQDALLRALASKHVRLTGSEVRFIRNAHEMTLVEFGEKFDVSHAAVIKWEKSGDKSTGMNWSTEKDIRLFVASKLMSKPTEFIAIYKELDEKASEDEILLKIDARKVA